MSTFHDMYHLYIHQKEKEKEKKTKKILKLKTITKIHIEFEHAKLFITFSVDLFPHGKLIRIINRVGMKV